jgi:hypothetical protein
MQRVEISPVNVWLTIPVRVVTAQLGPAHS